MDPQILLEGSLGTAALVSIPLIPFYLRRIAPSLEVVADYLKTIVESIKEGKLP